MDNSTVTWRLRVAFVIVFVTMAATYAVNPVTGSVGKINGVKTWVLPATDNGLIPSQCWHAVGSSPDGDIYVGGMDHRTNSALYRLKMSDDMLYYVGDARAASAAAGNLQPDEPIEKFHTRPTFHRGRVYVANLNASNGNDRYLQVRGFHWYAYDLAQDRFIDLSASEPGGTAVEHGGIVTLAIDHRLRRIYGAMLPVCNVYQYDILAGRTSNLGRWPSMNQSYCYFNRVMWIDSQSRLYTTAGNGVNPTVSMPDDSAVFRHVHFYDPATGWGERKDWQIVRNAIETGQWTRDRKRFYCADDQGNIYRFSEEGPGFSRIGKVDFGTGYLWVFHLSPDGKKIYLVPSNGPDALIEYDIASSTYRRLCGMADLATPIAGRPSKTGYDAWDNQGRFYFTAFGSSSSANVVLTRVDPVRLKVSLGLLPALVEVSMTPANTGTSVVVSRSGGSTTAALEVTCEIVQSGRMYDEYSTLVRTVTIPAGSLSVAVGLTQLAVPDSLYATGYSVAVVPNGNLYVGTALRSVAFPAGGTSPIRWNPLVDKRTTHGLTQKYAYILATPSGTIVRQGGAHCLESIVAQNLAMPRGVYLLNLTSSGIGTRQTIIVAGGSSSCRQNIMQNIIMKRRSML